MAKKKPTSSYWEKRFELLQNEALRPADEYLLDLGEIYERTAQEIEQKMLYWTKRFADNNDLSMAEAKKILEAGELKEFHWTLEEYAKKAAKGSAWAKEVENASARVHLSRLEAMRLDLKGVVESAVPEDLRWLFEEVYERAYYGAGHEIARGFGTTFPMQKIDDKALDRVLRKPWTTDARTFSDRLWENKAKLIAELQDTLARGLILGTSQDKLIREMRDKMGTSYANARRIVRTESAFFSAAGDRDAYDSLGVKKFQILATLDTRTSEICQEMDQKVFDFKDYEIGITAPPFHPNCRTTTVPYFDDMAEIEVRAARDTKGNTVMVRGDMGYNEWKERIEIESLGIDGFEDRPNKFVVDRVLSGEYGHKINKDMQRPHMQSTVKPGRSYLFDHIDPQGLYNKYAGNGRMELTKAGDISNREICVADHYIGIDANSGKPTRAFKIHHSYNRTHIVPRLEDPEWL